MENLPEEIIDLILKRLSSIEDVIRSGAVCKSWQSVVKKLGKKTFTHPWMMLARNDSNPTHRSFYCLSTKKVFNFILPELQDTRCWGSPYGWLVTFGFDLNISLFNPFSRIQLPLPPQRTFDRQYTSDRKYRGPLTPEELRRSFVEKIVLSSSPLSEEENCIVVAIYAKSRTLAFAKPGDQVWTPIQCDDCFWFHDVVFFEGQFYAANNSGEVVVCEINTSCPSAKLVAPPPLEIFHPMDKAYLVELSGDLLLIERVINEDEDKKYGLRSFNFRTESFLIYRLDFDNKCWEQIFDLGEYAVFIGANTSFAVSITENSEYERNSIYFSDDDAMVYVLMKFCDMGVVNLDCNSQHGKAKPIYSGGIGNVLSSFSRPIFLVPNF